MKTRKISIENIGVLNNIISKYVPNNIRQIVRDHTDKVNKRWQNNKEYRPGSNEYIRQQEEIKRIESLPDYDIKYTDRISIINKNGQEILSLHLGTLTLNEVRYFDHDDHEYSFSDDSESSNKYIEEVKYNFLSSNTHWNHEIYTSYSQIFNNTVIADCMADSTTDKLFYSLVNGYKEEYQKYIYLFDKKIKEALSQGYNVEIYQNKINYIQYLLIEGDTDIEYKLSYLDEIFKIKYYWYENVKTRFGEYSYRFNSVIEEYEYAKENIYEENINTNDNNN